MRRGTNLDEATRVVLAGGLVAMPTETVYGLAADATSSAAIARIYAAKGRPSGHPVIVHLATGTALSQVAAAMSPDASRDAALLADAFWPGPMTLIVPRGPGVAVEVSGGSSSVGVRVPAHPLAQQLLARVGRPLAAPSANRFGSVSPTTADHVVADLGELVDYVLDGGPCDVGVESTIIDLTSEIPTLLRPGGLARADIEAVLGRTLASPNAQSPSVPGSLASHYAPRAVLALVSELAAHDCALAALARGLRVAVLTTVSAARRLTIPNGAILVTLADDAADSARQLFATLRQLDDQGFEHIVAVADATNWAVGIGEAVVDRLQRAAGPRGEVHE